MNAKLKIYLIAFLIVILSSGTPLATDIYDSAPSFSPYYAGSVRSDVLYDALEELNYIRGLIGVPNNVTLDSEYIRKAQHGAVLLDAIGVVSHTPDKPSDMSDSFYELGYDATTHGNIAWGSAGMTLKLSTKIFMDDSDSSNISALGHRRWIMNPRMKRTGFGISTRGGYEVTYVIEEFPHSGEDNTLTEEEYARYLEWLKWPIPDEFITWPVYKHKHPLTYFDAGTAWSVTLNKDVFDSINESAVSVKLTRTSDGRTWNFSSSDSNGYFGIDTQNIAYDPCIIFRPDNISGYSDSEIWQVEISGLTLSNGENADISYVVQFTGDLTGYEEDTPYSKHNNNNEDSSSGGCSTGFTVFYALTALLILGIPRVKYKRVGR